MLEMQAFKHESINISPIFMQNHIHKYCYLEIKSY